MVENDRLYYLGRQYDKKESTVSGGKAGGAYRDIKNFEKLRKASKKQKEQTLYELYSNLNDDSRELKADVAKDLWGVYSGNDLEFKEQLEKYFGSVETIYDTLETNSQVKSLLNKVIQPFLSKDRVFTIVPDSIDIDTAERLESLLDKQVKKAEIKEQNIKALKDSLIHGISFLSIGWEAKELSLPRRTWEKRESINPQTGEKVISTNLTEELETVTVENPDFKTELITDILYPRASRWKDLPYVIRLETISKKVFNERYDKNLDEISLSDESHTEHEDQFEELLDNVPGTNHDFGDRSRNEVKIAHFYFKDESYYVLQLEGAEIKGNFTEFYGELVYEGRSPVPGLAIPIIPLVVEPITGRLEGESLVNIIKQEVRKILEVENLHMKALREEANAPLWYEKASGFDVNEYLNRRANQPIGVEDLQGIQKGEFFTTSPNFLQTRQFTKQSLDSVTGSSDFFNGRIGASARLSGVDSLIGMALSRLSVMQSQYNDFLVKQADTLILLNRAFLPKEYVLKNTSLEAPESIESFSIPYPVNIKTYTPVGGGSDASVRLQAIYNALNMALQLEQTQPGQFDVNALLAYYFSEAGMPEIRRFMLQTPITKNEKNLINMIDQLTRLQQNSSLMNNENAQGMSPEQQQASFNNNGGGMSSILESSGGNQSNLDL